MKRRKQKSSNRGKFRLPLHVYLAYLLVCTFLMTGVSFSRYVSRASAGDAARVASGGITVTGAAAGTNLVLSNDQQSATYQFRVSNTTSGTQSEVAIRYDVVVTLDEALPDGVTVQLDRESRSSNNGTQYTFSNVGTFPAGSSPAQEHTLTFSCNDLAPSKYDYTTNITITVRAEQID